tara:strand:- start:231 stop:986 length:756 start_codon:yes stop_codon:yes gene_type:complete
MSKTAIITGASKRIGRSIAINLAKQGYDIVVHYNRSKSDAQKLVKEIKTIGVNAFSISLDLNRTKKVKDFFYKVKKKTSNIQVLINNASLFEFDNLRKLSEKSFDNHININLKSPLMLSKYFVENLEHKEGSIINILDQRVSNITPYFLSYTISKVGLYTLTKNLALSLAPNIRVNAIAPGPTLKSSRQNLKQFSEQIKRTPLKQQVSLKDINDGINFLNESKSVTGQVLYLDSGQNLGWAHTRSKKFTDD